MRLIARVLLEVLEAIDDFVDWLRRKHWEYEFAPSGTHVIPHGDLIDHEWDTLDGCVCGPDVRFDRHPPRVQHFALDGRQVKVWL